MHKDTPLTHAQTQTKFSQFFLKRMLLDFLIVATNGTIILVY